MCSTLGKSKHNDDESATTESGRRREVWIVYWRDHFVDIASPSCWKWSILTILDQTKVLVFLPLCSTLGKSKHNDDESATTESQGEKKCGFFSSFTHTVSKFVLLRALYPQFKQSSDIKRYETRTRNAKTSSSAIVHYSRQVQAQQWRKRDNWVLRAERSVDF